MTTVHAYAAPAAGAPLEPFEYELGELGPNQVDVQVTHCGICHSDLSMRDNDWGLTQYPFVGGHEAAGTIAAVGELVTNLKVGDRVGVGWHSSSCMTCRYCMGGDHNLCAQQEGSIVGRHGGFGDLVRCHQAFAIPIPDGIELSDAGPLFCGGITVFDPIRRLVEPTDRVGVIGIGGLGHMALGFARAWGCHVTAFTSTGAKAEEAKALGAHEVVNSRDDAEIEKCAGSLDFIISTVNVPLNWEAYFNALAPKGNFHVAGAVLEPIPVGAMGMIMGQKSMTGSPVGSPSAILTMLDFAARHEVKPQTEVVKMSDANAAFEHLEAGKARYRIVLEV